MARVAPWLVASAAALVIWFGIIAPRIWGECRASGHSTLYCSRLVVR